MANSREGGGLEGRAGGRVGWQRRNAFTGGSWCLTTCTLAVDRHKNLVLLPNLCENESGPAKACLSVPLDVMGLRLAPRPSPALVGQPSLGRVALCSPRNALRHNRHLTPSPVQSPGRVSLAWTVISSGRRTTTALPMLPSS